MPQVRPSVGLTWDDCPRHPAGSELVSAIPKLPLPGLASKRRTRTGGTRLKPLTIMSDLDADLKVSSSTEAACSSFLVVGIGLGGLRLRLWPLPNGPRGVGEGKDERSQPSVSDVDSPMLHWFNLFMSEMQDTRGFGAGNRTEVRYKSSCFRKQTLKTNENRCRKP